MGRTARHCRSALLALALLTPQPSAALDVVGQNHLDLQWSEASGPVAAYGVYVARDGVFPEMPDIWVETPAARVEGAFGDVIRVQVAAFDVDGNQGPVSESSDEIRFLEPPPPPDPEPEPEPEPDPEPEPEPEPDPEPEPEPEPDPEPEPAPAAEPGDSEASCGDFDGDGHADLFWRDQLAGANEIWLMSSPDQPQRIPLPQVDDLEWQVVATGDFDGDGDADLFWRNPTSGDNAIWWMDAQGLETETPVDPMQSGWDVAGSGDLDGDGRDDLAWGRGIEASVWLMRGLDAPSVLPAPVRTREPLELAAVADYSGDGMADLLWLGPDSGQVAYWRFGARRLSSLRADAPGPEWTLGASGDFDADARADLLWARQDGELSLWLRHGRKRISELAVEAVDAGWELAGEGDHDGDGRTDLVWLHPESGSVVLWLMDADQVVAELPLAPSE